jgi:hypothetical protein
MMAMISPALEVRMLVKHSGQIESSKEWSNADE